MVPATTGAGTWRRLARAATPTVAPTTGPSATFCGLSPIRPHAVPAATAMPSGPDPVDRAAAHANGAARAELNAIRCQSAGIWPGRWRARANASEVPSPTAPRTAAIAAARRPRRFLGVRGLASFPVRFGMLVRRPPPDASSRPDPTGQRDGSGSGSSTD